MKAKPFFGRTVGCPRPRAPRRDRSNPIPEPSRAPREGDRAAKMGVPLLRHPSASKEAELKRGLSLEVTSYPQPGRTTKSLHLLHPGRRERPVATREWSSDPDWARDPGSQWDVLRWASTGGAVHPGPRPAAARTTGAEISSRLWEFRSGPGRRLRPHARE